MNVNELKKQVSECTKCKDLLHCKENLMCPAIMSHLNAEIMIIGTNPGVGLEEERNRSYENVLINSRQGKMFLTPLLEKLNLDYQKICWSNICKCPTHNNRPITFEEAHNCYHFLQEQINMLSNLKVVVVLGNIAKDYVLTHQLKTNGAKIIYFVHPSWIFITGNYDMIDELASKILGAMR